MEILKKIIYHYFAGVLFSASLIILIVLFDYFLNGYMQYPELKNFIKAILLSGVSFGFTHFASAEIDKSNKQKNN